jgi:CBS domain-containing protein
LLDRGSWRKFLVTNATGQLVGTIELDALRQVPMAQWSTTPVRELMQSSAALATVSADRSLLEVVKLLEEQKLPALPVISENGVLLGLLEKVSILGLLQNRADVQPA